MIASEAAFPSRSFKHILHASLPPGGPNDLPPFLPEQTPGRDLPPVLPEELPGNDLPPRRQIDLPDPVESPPFDERMPADDIVPLDHPETPVELPDVDPGPDYGDRPLLAALKR